MTVLAQAPVEEEHHAGPPRGVLPVLLAGTFIALR